MDETYVREADWDSGVFACQLNYCPGRGGADHVVVRPIGLDEPAPDPQPWDASMSAPRRADCKVYLLEAKGFVSKERAVPTLKTWAENINPVHMPEFWTPARTVGMRWALINKPGRVVVAHLRGENDGVVTFPGGSRNYQVVAQVVLARGRFNQLMRDVSAMAKVVSGIEVPPAMYQEAELCAQCRESASEEIETRQHVDLSAVALDSEELLDAATTIRHRLEYEVGRVVSGSALPDGFAYARPFLYEVADALMPDAELEHARRMVNAVVEDAGVRATYSVIRGNDRQQTLRVAQSILLAILAAVALFASLAAITAQNVNVITPVPTAALWSVAAVGVAAAIAMVSAAVYGAMRDHHDRGWPIPLAVLLFAVFLGAVLAAFLDRAGDLVTIAGVLAVGLACGLTALAVVLGRRHHRPRPRVKHAIRAT